MSIFPENPSYSIDSGTLNVVLGNGNCIIVASDSQRTTNEGGQEKYSNDCKKLFLVGKQRALVIAGFAGISYPGLTEKIILQLPTLLESDIERCGEHIDFYDRRSWNDEMPSSDLPEEFKKVGTDQTPIYGGLVLRGPYV